MLGRVSAEDLILRRDHRTDVTLLGYLSHGHSLGKRNVNGETQCLSNHDRFGLVRDEAVLRQCIVKPGGLVVTARFPFGPLYIGVGLVMAQCVTDQLPNRVCGDGAKIVVADETPSTRKDHQPQQTRTPISRDALR